MIIVGQDKDVIVNFDKNEAIYIEERVEKRERIDKTERVVKTESVEKIEISVRGDYLYRIGRYKTKERAKELLEEIARKYKDCNEHLVSTGYGYVKNEVFYMPEE